MDELEQYAGYDSLDTMIDDDTAYNTVFQAWYHNNLLDVLHLIRRVLSLNYYKDKAHTLVIQQMRDTD